MKCPECEKLLDMRVQIGVKVPSDLEGQFTKGMFRRKDVQIEYARWETATYDCPNCGHHIGRMKTEHKKRMTVENWYVKEQIKRELI